jgi:hypothetical protein
MDEDQELETTSEEAEMIELAWGLIANVKWENQSVDWREAAVRWRERYHTWLSEHLMYEGGPIE